MLERPGAKKHWLSGARRARKASHPPTNWGVCCSHGRGGGDRERCLAARDGVGWLGASTVAKCGAPCSAHAHAA
eukprot:7147861-Prymnesium_polylepis.2